MDQLVSLIMGTSTTLDVYVIVRLVVIMVSLEMFAVICSMLAGFKGR